MKVDAKVLTSVPQLFSTLGMQTTIFSWVAFALSTRALHHDNWLPATIGNLCYLLIGVSCYFNMTPVYVFPTQLAATLVTATMYVGPHMYDGIDTVIASQPPSDDDDAAPALPVPVPTNCGGAVNFNMTFIILQWIAFGILVLLLGLLVAAERLRRTRPGRIKVRSAVRRRPARSHLAPDPPRPAH